MSLEDQHTSYGIGYGQLLTLAPSLHEAREVFLSLGREKAEVRA